MFGIMRGGTKFNKPITWVVVRTVNFNGNSHIVAGLQTSRQAQAVTKEYELCDPHGDYQYWPMTTYDAWRYGIIRMDQLAPSGRYTGTIIV